MAQYRVLIVDDNTSFTESVRGYFTAEESISQVDAAADGREALELMKANRYDILLLDLIMPHIDGLGVLDASGKGEAAVFPSLGFLFAVGGEVVDVFGNHLDVFLFHLVLSFLI